MTPKEKAQELVDKYKPYSYGVTEKNIIDCAKHFAIICVDEIINALDESLINADIEWYKQIKREIESL